MSAAPALGIRANYAQFGLLVLVNALVGAMVGMERSILPAIAEHEFRLAAHSAILAFIAVFGLSKALTNYFAGRWSDRYGRKLVLVAGWLVAAPVPFLLMWAPSWNWVLFANLLLGVSQGLAWSSTVIMKIDLAGPRNRGLAMGINEFAGYLALALAALATGWIAAHYGLRPQPFYLGVAFVTLGALLSIALVRETAPYAAHEAALQARQPVPPAPKAQTFAINQAGFTNNLNDGMAWGLFPMLFAAAGMGLAEIGWLAALYPAVWGIGQLFTGALSDLTGRKSLSATGMWVQAGGIALTALSSGFPGFAAGAIVLGTGTAMVYPTLLAAIGDAVPAGARASAVGGYRLWRDLGYVAGALLSGAVADLFGLASALWLVAAVTFLSGVLAALRLRETRWT